jgi:hypothetical protein
MPLSDFYDSMKGATPIESSVSKSPQLPNPETQVTPALRTTLPGPLIYSGDSVKQYVRPGSSCFRIAPLPPSGLPTINSASAGTAEVVQSQSNAGSGLTSVGLAMPDIFSVTNSPLTKNGVIDVSLVPQEPNTFLGGLGDPLDASLSFLTTSSGTVFDLGPIVASTATDCTVLCMYQPYVTVVPNTFPLLVSGSALATYISYPAPASYTVSGTTANSTNAQLLLNLFTNGSAPVGIQRNSAAGNSSTPTNILLPGSVTAGNAILAVFGILGGVATPPIIYDSQGNSYAFLEAISKNGSIGLAAYIATNITAGPLTVTMGPTDPTVSNCVLEVYEVSNIITPPAIPVFRAIISSDLPPINLSVDGHGGAVGVLPVGSGGTGSNLSGTGGTNKVLQQSTSGGNVSVAQLSFSQLSGVISQSSLPASVPDIVVEGSLGPPGDNTNQTSAISSTALYTPGSNGLFQVDVYEEITVGGIGTLQTTIAYTDDIGATTVTPIATPLSAVSPGRALGSAVIRVAAGNAINFSTAFGSGTYSVFIRVRSIT